MDEEGRVVQPRGETNARHESATAAADHHRHDAIDNSNVQDPSILERISSDSYFAASSEEPFVLLVHRGHCTFVEKAENAAKAGFYNLVIWNNTPENSLKLLTDDGKGSALRSKMVLVSEEVGKKMIQWMERNPREVVRVTFGFCGGHPISLDDDDGECEQREIVAV
eukprot:CAMPEP_0117450368 /NCGR_PEP_ID=MMETSP0759-20121206/8431_1 /TAXON_ID=63605 /ORGANISM="Percolomonas cosmopolitus, Strain WS" /LENGTH=166 /DNA_ID=CAMNT_0005242885 /DNA_START=1095 /DNA_END=1593 /DNA_ORIENTATION=-